MSGKRWAMMLAKHPNATPRVYCFDTEAERDQWIAQNTETRSLLGKRDPLVKAYRNRKDLGS